MPDPMTTTPRMTAVFEYDLKQHPGNPFHADTPFGRPLVLQPGDFSEADCEAVAEDRGTAMTANPFADLCADPALLAEAVEVLEEILSVDPFEAPLAAANAEQRAADLITALLAQNAAQEAQIKELQRTYDDLYSDALADAKSDAQEFDSDLWEMVRAYLDDLHFDWRDFMEDGVTADEAMTHIRECMNEETRRAEAAETALAAMTKERDEHHQNWQRAFNANVRWLEKCEAQQEALAAERAKVAKLVEALTVARMSAGWQSMSKETRDMISAAITEAGK